jgi:hypothetical protein
LARGASGFCRPAAPRKIELGKQESRKLEENRQI